MNKVSIVFLFAMLAVLCSCREKISYGTSLALKNQLHDSIYLTLYPKESNYSFMEKFRLRESQVVNFYGKSGHDNSPHEIIESVFDSIVINYKGSSIFFSADTVTGCSVNIYHDLDIWNSKIVEFDTPDNFNRNPHEDIVHTFTLTSDLLLPY